MPAAAPIPGSFGSLQLFRVLLCDAFKGRVALSSVDLRRYCLTKLYKAGATVTSTTQLLVWLRVLRNSGNFIERGERFHEVSCDAGDEDFAKSLCALLFRQMAEVGLLNDVFTEGSLTWDSGDRSLVVIPSRIPLARANIIALLRTLGALKEGDVGDAVLFVDPNLVHVLVDMVCLHSPAKLSGGLTPEELAKLKQYQNAQGEHAELYVVQYERHRLADHPRLDLIRRVSTEDVTLGYDIISFESSKSVIPDRFIEVKSYKGEPHFYWSSGELDAARRIGALYHLYLVSVDLVDGQGYEPTVIANPAHLILESNSDWHVTPNTWYVARGTVSVDRAAET